MRGPSQYVIKRARQAFLENVTGRRMGTKLAGVKRGVYLRDSLTLRTPLFGRPVTWP